MTTDRQDNIEKMKVISYVQLVWFLERAWISSANCMDPKEAVN